MNPDTIFQGSNCRRAGDRHFEENVLLNNVVQMLEKKRF
jgi:hypothetical protein